MHLQKPPTVSVSTPYPRQCSARMHWHTAGPGDYANKCSLPLRKYAFPPVSLLAQTLCKIREDEEQVLLVAPYWPNRTWFPELMLSHDSPSLANSFEEGSAFSEMVASATRVQTSETSMCGPWMGCRGTR